MRGQGLRTWNNCSELKETWEIMKLFDCPIDGGMLPEKLLAPRLRLRRRDKL